MNARQPENCEPWFGPITTGYYQRLLWLPCVQDLLPLYYFIIGGRSGLQFAELGGHKRIGPPSAAGTCWTAAATNVPTSPIVRTAILIARFMGSFSLICDKCSVQKHLRGCGIIRHVSTGYAKSFTLPCSPPPDPGKRPSTPIRHALAFS
jgi:hypothetical protein